MRKVMPRHRGRLCRLALSPRVPAPSRSVARPRVMRAMFALWLGLRAEEKVGQCSEETAPFQSGQSYFFFAFLAFLAAFFAFFAIGPPEGVQLVPDGDTGLHVELHLESQVFTSRCLSVPPSYQM
jgi:hypothetical protein